MTYLPDTYGCVVTFGWHSFGFHAADRELLFVVNSIARAAEIVREDGLRHLRQVWRDHLLRQEAEEARVNNLP